MDEIQKKISSIMGSKTSDDGSSKKPKKKSFSHKKSNSSSSSSTARSMGLSASVESKSSKRSDDKKNRRSDSSSVGSALSDDNGFEVVGNIGDVIHEEVAPDCRLEDTHTQCLPDGSVAVSDTDLDQLVLVEEQWEEEQRNSNRSLQKPSAAGSTSHCMRSLYGSTASSKEVAEIIGPLPSALLSQDEKPIDKRIQYHARLIPDETRVQNRLIRRGAIDKKSIFTNPDDNSLDGGKREIKPRRGPLPAVFVSDFMKSLVMIQSPNPQEKNGSLKSRWIFSGVLNGWPGFQTLELVSVTCRTADKMSNLMDSDKTNILRKQMMRHRLVRIWHTDKEGAQEIPPHIHSDVLQGAMELRVTLRAPAYAIEGYSLDNPGYVFWYEACRQRSRSSLTKPSSGLAALSDRMLFGQDMVNTMEQEASDGTGHGDSKCTKLHFISHRYATGARREMPRDKLTYHSIVVLEWDHRQYVTVIESAYLHGLGGNAGKSNWYEDKSEPLTKIYKAFSPSMVLPWQTNMMEIRCNDVPHSSDMFQFEQFIKKYTGSKERFLDPNYTYSSDCRLTFSSKKHIAQYLCNYIRRDSSYSELNRNCQTFAADFFGFMAGKKDIQPFHALNRVDYQNRAHNFLYNADMF